MKTRSIASFVCAAASVVMLTLAPSGTVQAQEVRWSLGLAAPGVQLGVGNAPQVLLVQPDYQPVYLTARPVYVAPPRVVYVRPAPVVLQPVPQYIRAEWRYGGHRHGWEERRERQEHWEGQHSDRGEHERRG